MNPIIVTVLVYACNFLMFVLPLKVSATTISPGDFVIGNQLAPGGPGNLLLVNPTDGHTSILSSDVLVPTGLAFDQNGKLFVTDSIRGSTGVTFGSILQIDPMTGNPTLVTSGRSLVFPVGLAIGVDEIFVLNGSNAFGLPAALVRVNPMTGQQTVISTGGLLSNPTDLAIEKNGTIVIANDSKVIRTNPATGVQTVVSSGGNIFLPTGIAMT